MREDSLNHWMEGMKSAPTARRTTTPADPEAHYNAQGLRKLDPVGWWRRRFADAGNPGSQNPGKTETKSAPATQWVQFMAAGGMQGLEPLRREKRVARNRFLMMFFLFLLILCGLFSAMRP